MPMQKSILQLLVVLAILFSVLMFSSLGMAFREEIEIVNKTGTPISVTPIGIWHGSSKRSALPVIASRITNWPALKNGGFTIGPGQSIVIDYDMDDINPSEIYINAGPTAIHEMKMKSRSSENYDYDKDRRVEITDLATLPAASANVTAAALGANKNEWRVGWICLLVFGPLVIAFFLWGLGRVMEQQKTGISAAILFLLFIPNSVTWAQETRQSKGPNRFHMDRQSGRDDSLFLGFESTGSCARKLDIEYTSFGFTAKSNANSCFPRVKTDGYGVIYEVNGLATIRLLDGYYKHDVAYGGATYARDEELSKHVSKGVYVLPIGKEDYAWLHDAKILVLPDSEGKKVRATISWREVPKLALSGIEEEKAVSQDLFTGGVIEIRDRFHRVRKIELPQAASGIRPFVEIDQEPLGKEEAKKEEPTLSKTIK